MHSTLERYRDAIREEHDCSRLSFCEDCSFVYGLVQQLKAEGYIQCVECGEWAKSETDYCSAECCEKDEARTVRQ
jgi:hypothetical protein